MSAYSVHVMRVDEDLSTRFFSGGLYMQQVCNCELAAQMAAQSQIDILKSYGFACDMVDGVTIATDGDVMLYIWIEGEA